MNLNEFRQKVTNLEMAIWGETPQDETRKRIRFSNAELKIKHTSEQARLSIDKLEYDKEANELVLFV